MQAAICEATNHKAARAGYQSAGETIWNTHSAPNQRKREFGRKNLAFITNGREIGFLIKGAAANVNLTEAKIDRTRQDNVFGTHTSLQTTVVLYETLLMVPT